MDTLFPPQDPTANQDLLIASREALGLTQAQLAARMTELHGSRITQGYVSRVEKGLLSPTGERLELFAKALECTPDFLVMPGKTWSLGEGCLYHRNRASTKASTLRLLHARINILRLRLQRLGGIAGRPLPAFDWEPIRVGGLQSAQDVARAVRDTYGIKKGPVPSVTELAERMGVLIVALPLGVREVDATSLHPPDEPPLFVINTDAPADRQRFTLGHELGHIACSPEPGDDVEEMAQAFSAELLAPSQEILKDLRAAPITPARLLQLKAIWKISAAAVLRRAYDLMVISESRYRTINQQISALGWRSSEPEPLAPETPRVAPDLIAAAVESAGGIDKAAVAAGMTSPALQELFNDRLN